MYLLATFILQILKKFQTYEDMLFSGLKSPICHEQTFFGANHYHYFYQPISRFHCPKLKKILTADPELWGCAIFGPKMVHLPQTIFFGHLLIPFLSTYLPLSLCKILTKLFQGIQCYEDVQILGPKQPPISSNENFVRKPANEPSFFRLCLSTCQKSKSDINLLFMLIYMPKIKVRY